MSNLFRWRKVKTPKPPLEVEVAQKILDQMSDPVMASPWCSHCGGWHLRACPRVRRLVFKGSEVQEAEFWETWDDSHVWWQEEVAQVVADAENAKATN